MTKKGWIKAAWWRGLPLQKITVTRTEISEHWTLKYLDKYPYTCSSGCWQ